MPALEVVTLGTTGPLHQPVRFGPSQVIIGGDTRILVDVGWGATLRLYQASLPPQTVDAVFITHLHSDHTTDLADFLVMGWVGGRGEPVPIYGPDGTARTVAGYQQGLEADTRFRLAHHGEKLPSIGPAADVREVEARDDAIEITRIGDIRVLAFQVDHRPVMPALGYRFELDGASVVISGDTIPCPGLANGARGADILVCDAMNKAMMANLEAQLRSGGNLNQAALLEDAHDYHASVTEAGEIAQKAGVKHLVLSHVLPPVAPPAVPAFTSGVERVFQGQVSVAADLDRFAAG